jgi:alpha-glucosidase
MEAGTGFVPDQFSTISRSPRQIWQHRQPGKDIFVGNVDVATAVVAGVRVLRLRVMPDDLPTDHKERADLLNWPSSYALSAQALASIKWQPEGLEICDVVPGFSWQKSEDARYDFKFDLAADIKCLGLGERYSDLDLRGARHTLCSTDNPSHDEGADALYKAIPFAIFMECASASLTKGAAQSVAKGFALLLDSPAPQVWDLDKELDGKARIELFSRRGFILYAFTSAVLPDLVRAYTELTGRVSQPPRWSLGHQQSRWSYPDQDTALELARQFRERKIPCDTIVLDIDYMDDYRVFTSSDERFPDFNRMVAELARDHFRVVTAVDPGIKVDDNYLAYTDGLKQDVFCKTADGEVFVDRVWPGKAVFPDFMRADVRDWWAQKLDFYTSNGIAGIWNDMNEPAYFDTPGVKVDTFDELPEPQSQLFMQNDNGEIVGHYEVRNLYGSGMAQATHQALTKTRPSERPFILTRSAYAGIQRYSAVWLGDNKSWWEHLRLSLPMLVNIGLSGVPFAGVDIGGFGDTCDPEMLIRWYEIGIFFPFFRNHCWLKGRAQEPFAYSEPVEQKVKRLIEIRYQLLPYIIDLFRQSAVDGAPLMRPLAWSYGSDKTALSVFDQFMFGDDILVAPVLNRAQSHRNVYLPEGNWYRFDSDEVLVGGQWHYLSMPLGVCPAFVREGSILALCDGMQSTDDYAQADITFKVYGVRAYGSFYQDDGISFDWQDGKYFACNLAFEQGKLTASDIHSGLELKERKYFVSYRNSKTDFVVC